MKRKHLFASVAMAAVLVGCSQEELVQTNEVQTLGDRPMVEAPVFTFEGVDSRMTAEDVSANGFANIEWQAGDGFGYAVIDNYNPEGKTWATMFPIVDYISSNVLYQTEDGKNFYSHAESSVPMGNYLIYAPFDKERITRDPLAVQLPLTQVVKATENGMPSNSAIKAFYQDVTSPVLVAYDYINDEPKVNVSPKMRHIFAYPLVTLQLGNVQLLDENGFLKTTGNPARPVYESKITIEKIVFTGKDIITKGSIKNSAIAAKLALAENGKDLVWDATQFESNKTSDLLMTAKEGTVYDEVTVEFEGGVEISAAKKAQFFMVLPGDAYEAEDLEVLVYATINGESYVSAAKSTDAKAATIEPFRDAILLPGLPYSADEYNKLGDKKESAGTSMTYTVSGGFIPAKTATIGGYTAISNYDELVNFVENIAYRGEELIELTKEEAENLLTDEIPANDPDPKKHFVITATAAAPIVLDDAFVSTFNTSCVITSAGGVTSGSIEFDGYALDSKSNKVANLVLGDITWDAATPFGFENDYVYAAGNVVVKSAPAATIDVLSTANVDLNSALTTAVVVENNANGTVNVNSKAAHTINNIYGTLNINVNAAGSITNGDATKPEAQKNNDEYFGIMTVADGTNIIANVNNQKFGKMSIGRSVIAVANDGDIEMTHANGKLTVTGTGNVNNTVAAKVTNNAGTNKVYAVISYMRDLNTLGGYDDLTNLNKIVLNGTWDITDNVNLSTYSAIKTIDVLENGVIDMASATLDLNNATVNIYADVTWTGRDGSKSKITNATIVEKAKSETENYKLTLIDLSISGYQVCVNTVDGLQTAISAGETGVIALSGELALTAPLAINKDVTIKGGKLSGDQVVVTSNATFEGVQFDANKAGYGLQVSNNSDVTLKNCIIDNTEGFPLLVSTAAKNVTLDGCTIKGESNCYINPTTGKVVIKNCVFNPYSLCAEIYGNESKFEITGNTFYKSFTFTANGVLRSALTPACKTFCKAILANNTFMKENAKIAVTNNLPSAPANAGLNWFYINDASVLN